MASQGKQLLQDWLDRNEDPMAKIAVTDIDGVLRGKLVSREKLTSALSGGFGFCDVVMGWDSNDQLYDNVTFTGWHSGYPDAQVRLVPDTARRLPLEDNLLFMLGEFVGDAEAICPRGVLRRVLERCTKLGFQVKAGFEYEFFVFNETSTTAAAKGYRDLVPLTPGNFGYSILRNSVHAELHRDIMDLGTAMRMDIEGLHAETGPGVLEAALSVADGLEAADRANLFKTFMKVLAQRRDLLATFMAKWSNDVPGQSGHLHLSLVDDTGKNLFYDAKGDGTMSALQRHFVAGQQRLLPQFAAMVAPTVNSFSRLVPGYWAPINATWGIENRTCALRVIPGEKAQRVEFRIGAADGNPYLVMAAAVAAGIYGIEEKLELGSPITGNAYEDAKGAAEMPATLTAAATNLRQSSEAARYFGEDFVNHFAATREWEEREFQKHITDWELKRYFEII